MKKLLLSLVILTGMVSLCNAASSVRIPSRTQEQIANLDEWNILEAIYDLIATRKTRPLTQGETNTLNLYAKAYRSLYPSAN